jgi:carbamate kinase
VLAFGGNALLPDPFHPEEQADRAAELARAVHLLLADASGVVLVHGNAPQVGMILLRVEATRRRLPAEPLDMLVAETQGSVGYLLARALRNALAGEPSPPEVTSILTQVVVSADDAAFARPSKPVGPHYPARSAEILERQRGWHMVEVPGRGWRRVVPSPRPLEVVEHAAIATAAGAGQIVIAGGGGGIPVWRGPDGKLAGIECVIDKDRTAALLARTLDADAFVVLTGVPHVSLRYGTPREERLAELSVERAAELAASGEFPAGSMGPKIEATCAWVRATGKAALITDTARLWDALAGRAGTRIVAGGGPVPGSASGAQPSAP